ncbi:hypothetical protein HK405_005674, partial [Cladochytrium tenue]
MAINLYLFVVLSFAIALPANVASIAYLVYQYRGSCLEKVYSRFVIVNSITSVMWRDRSGVNAAGIWLHVAIGFINVMVLTFWPATQLGTWPLAATVNNIFDKLEKFLFIIIDVVLNVMFVMAFRSYSHVGGLSRKFRIITACSEVLSALGIAVDVVIIILMFQPDPMLYTMGHMLGAPFKLWLEIFMADLVRYIIKGKGNKPSTQELPNTPKPGDSKTSSSGGGGTSGVVTAGLMIQTKGGSKICRLTHSMRLAAAQLEAPPPPAAPSCRGRALPVTGLAALQTLLARTPTQPTMMMVTKSTAQVHPLPSPTLPPPRTTTTAPAAQQRRPQPPSDSDDGGDGRDANARNRKDGDGGAYGAAEAEIRRMAIGGGGEGSELSVGMTPRRMTSKTTGRRSCGELKEALSRRREAEQNEAAADAAERDEDEEESESATEPSEKEDSEVKRRLLFKPVFIPKEARDSLVDKDRQEAEECEAEEKRLLEIEERKAQPQKLLEEEIMKAEAA